MILNSQQQTAAERSSQDVCVVAGPGSGKTRVLVARFCWLIEQGVAPGRILAFTFTDKAAAEIKSRLANEFRGSPEILEQIERAWVSTMHGFCARLLREHAIDAGVDVGFSVWDQVTSATRLRQAAEQALDEQFGSDQDGSVSLLTALDVSSSPIGRRPDLPAALISVYEAARIAGEDLEGLANLRTEQPMPAISDILTAVGPVLDLSEEWSTAKRREKREQLRVWVDEARKLAANPITEQHFRVIDAFRPNLQGLTAPVKEVLRDCRDRLAPSVSQALATRHYMPQRERLVGVLRRIDSLYRSQKAETGALDFSDLEEHAVALLEDRPQIRERVRNRFEHILMDELQDTNPLQWRFVNLIRRPERFFAVGDPNQSIFGFRHADPGVYRGYRGELERAGLEVDKLTANYRTRPQILDTVEQLLEGQPGLETEPMEAGRDFPEVSGPSVEAWVAEGESTEGAEEHEAAWVAHRIAEIREAEGRSWRDFAVLARKVSALRTVEQALKQRRIPCLVVGGRTLLESREVLDLILALSVIANTADEVCLAGLLRSPLVGVSDETLLRLKLEGDLWESMNDSAWLRTAGCDPDDIERIEWFRLTVEQLRANRDTISPDILLSRLLDESGYEDTLADHESANIEKSLVLVRAVWEQQHLSPADLVTWLAEVRSAESEAEAPPSEAADAVRLMTVHGAKGLEFPVVFVAALHKGVSSALDPISYSAKAGFGVRWRDPVTGKRAPDGAFASIESEQKRKSAEEEMRLLYVALTRAEDHLVLSYAAAERSRGSAWSRLVAERLQPQPVELTPENGRPPELHIPPASEPPGLLDPSETGGQHDSSAAVTDLTEFQACPRRYYLGRYLGFDSTDSLPAAHPAAADLGTQVHKILAGEEVEEPSQEALDLVESFRNGPLNARMQRASRTEHEFEFRIAIENIVLRGKIDLWFEEAGELVLVDYKTDRDESRREPYELQLRLYALALERLTGRVPDRALLCYLRSGRDLDVSRDKDALDSVRVTVRRFRDAQEHLAFPLCESGHCTHCPYFEGMCPAGS